MNEERRIEIEEDGEAVRPPKARVSDAPASGSAGFCDRKPSR